MAYSQSHVTHSDTPILFHIHSRSVLRMKEKVKAVLDAVAAELSGHVRICDTDNLLETLLPVPSETLDAIFASVKNTGNYSATQQRWKGFPTAKDARESLFYQPFLTAAEAIRAAVPDGTKNCLEGQWYDRHDKSPESSQESADARPDLLFVSRPMVVKKLEEEVRVLEQEARQSVPLPSSPEQEKLEGQQSIWWRQVHIPVEIKKANTKELFEQGFVQTCCYIRLALREQLDRRFCIALLLCGDALTVFFNDRSGLFFTLDSINIHTDPRKFIQVIAALSILKPCRIGWDPHMKVYDPVSREAKVSYLVGDEARFFKPSLAKTHWEIDVPSRVEGQRETVITIAAISISRAEVMSGRATLVWEVIRKAPNFDINEIFVLKRYWRPYQQAKNGEDILPSFMPEGERYRKVPSWEDRIFSDEDIQVADNENDSTLEHIRRGLETVHFSPKQGSRKRFLEDDNWDHLKTTLDPNAKRFIYANEVALVSRVHTQIMHTYTGWPLRHFKDLNELLRVIRDILLEHKHLYYNGLVLHRDISIENIIIMPRNDETVGRLIDLDHAKVVSSSKTRVTPNVSYEEVQDFKTMCRLSKRFPSIDEEVLEACIASIPDKDLTRALNYITSVVRIRVEHFGLDISREIKLTDMGWYHQIKASPDFSTHEARPGHQTGTLPFMSVEVLEEAPIFEDPNGCDEQWCHEAINDIESLFWVLTFICLVRKGPGINMLRTELLEDDPKDKELQNLLYSYFDSDNEDSISVKKRRVFTQKNRMNNDILVNFHPYFEPLKNMMVQWLRIMILAYEHRKFEYYTIHDQIIHIVDQAIENLSNSQLNEDPKTKVETKRRQDLRKERMKWFKGRSDETAFDTSSDQKAASALEFSPQRPIRVSAVGSSLQLPAEPGSPSPNPKRQKLENVQSLGDMVI